MGFFLHFYFCMAPILVEGLPRCVIHAPSAQCIAVDHEIDDLPNGYNGLEEWPVSLRRAAVGSLLDSRSVNLNADMTHGRVTSHRGVNRIDAKLSILWLTANTGLNPGVQRDRSRFPISEQTSVNAPATPPNPIPGRGKTRL